MVFLSAFSLVEYLVQLLLIGIIQTNYFCDLTYSGISNDVALDNQSAFGDNRNDRRNHSLHFIQLKEKMNLNYKTNRVVTRRCPQSETIEIN